MATEEGGNEKEEPKLDSETALARIKVLIKRYYEMRGREDSIDSYNEEPQLIEDIDDILSNTNLDLKKVILEQLELDGDRGRVRRFI